MRSSSSSSSSSRRTTHTDNNKPCPCHAMSAGQCSPFPPGWPALRDRASAALSPGSSRAATARAQDVMDKQCSATPGPCPAAAAAQLRAQGCADGMRGCAFVCPFARGGTPPTTTPHHHLADVGKWKVEGARFVGHSVTIPPLLGQDGTATVCVCAGGWSRAPSRERDPGPRLTRCMHAALTAQSELCFPLGPRAKRNGVQKEIPCGDGSRVAVARHALASRQEGVVGGRESGKRSSAPCRR
jgi:hypothetical protein